MSIATKERPILFSSSMVKAILAGRKTQTRRVVNPQPPEGQAIGLCHYSPTGWACCDDPKYIKPDGCTCKPVRCPYGGIGDRLWVRETWRCNHFGGMRIEYKAGGPCFEYEDWPDDVAPPYVLPTTASRVRRAEKQLDGEKIPDAWRPSIHMPRWASRITLEITDVRVQRLQEISEEDAIAEGATSRPSCYGHLNRYDGWSMDWSEVGTPSRYGTDGVLTERDVCLDSARHAFGSYINTLHGGPNWNLMPEPSLWDKDPWVWAVSFAVLSCEGGAQ